VILSSHLEMPLPAGLAQRVPHHALGEYRAVALDGEMRQDHAREPWVQELQSEPRSGLIREVPVAGSTSRSHSDSA
jgi:hypothetical protein